MTNETIYHITQRQSWQSAQAAGNYVADSLAAQGFIHASTLDQVVDTANLLYTGQDGLVLLCIDSGRLTAPLEREAANAAGHRDEVVVFPHIYGSLNLDAVINVVDFPSGANGRFVLPEALRGG